MNNKLNIKQLCIVTIYDPNPNYGNKLQNYATKKYFENHSFSVWTLVSQTQRQRIKLILKCIINAFTLYKLKSRNNQLYWRKQLLFDSFNERYLSPDDSFIKGHFDNNKYDYYVLGSDQVWNPTWYGINEKKEALFLLTFVESKKIICMAPSFGISEFPDKWRDWFSKNLMRFPKLSVRENAGAKIIKDLTGRDAEVLIDPTLLLSVHEWRQIEKEPKSGRLKNKYILTYFLGEKSEKDKNDIIRFAKENNLAIVNLLDFEQPDIYVSGPSEFVWLIDHAELVLTDSYHGSIFSFIFNKPFIVCDRNKDECDMNSRLDTLLTKFYIERKYVSSGLDNDIWEHDYTEGYKQLEIEREKFKNYLKKALDD